MYNANDCIIGTRCEVTDDFLVNVRKKRMVKRGTIKGYYLNNYWHPFVYSAFHIEFDDGMKTTYLAKDVKFLS